MDANPHEIRDQVEALHKLMCAGHHNQLMTQIREIQPPLRAVTVMAYLMDWLSPKSRQILLGLLISRLNDSTK